MMVENEKTISHAVKPPIVLPPWLVVLGALALYGLTLHPWVTFGSLPFASAITGWDWHPGPLPWRPQPQYPLFFVFDSSLAPFARRLAGGGLECLYRRLRGLDAGHPGPFRAAVVA